MLLKKYISVLQLLNLPRCRRDKVDNFYSNVCIINQVKTPIFVFPHFLEHYRFLKVKNIFFEHSSPKVFSDKLSEFSIFLAWPAILDIYSHALLIIVSRFFLNSYSLLAVTVCLLLKIISACLHICSRRRVLLFETIIIQGDKF